VFGIGQPLAGPAHRLDHVEVPQIVRVGAVDSDEQQRPILFDRHRILFVNHCSTVAHIRNLIHSGMRRS